MRQRARERENCKHVSLFEHTCFNMCKHVCLSMFRLWENGTCVCVCACVFYDCCAQPHPFLSCMLDCKASLLSPQPPSLHHHRLSFFATSAQPTILGPLAALSHPRRRLNGVGGNCQEVNAPEVTHITVSVKQYSEKQTCQCTQL